MRYENIHTKIRGGERGVLLLIVSQRVSQPPKCVCVCVCFLARADLHIYTHFLSHSITHAHTRVRTQTRMHSGVPVQFEACCH